MIAGINAIRLKNTAKWQIHRRTSYGTGLSINFMQWFCPEEPLLPDIRPHFRTGIKMQPEICNSCAETEKSIHARFYTRLIFNTLRNTSVDWSCFLRAYIHRQNL